MNNERFKNIKLLYVENEAMVRKYAMPYFNRLFYKVYEAENTLSALKIFKKEKPQILITDIKMDNLSGIDLIKEIRTFDKNCQIIILSAFLDTKYLLEAIELNLVKYLTKPIKQEELNTALIQCTNNLESNNFENVYFSNDCVFNTTKNTLQFQNTDIKLTQKEMSILNLFCSNLNRVITYQEIENIVWYDSVMSEDALRSLIKKLRKKLPHGSLENIAKVGYKINLVDI